MLPTFSIHVVCYRGPYTLQTYTSNLFSLLYLLIHNTESPALLKMVKTPRQARKTSSIQNWLKVKLCFRTSIGRSASIFVMIQVVTSKDVFFPALAYVIYIFLSAFTFDIHRPTSFLQVAMSFGEKTKILIIEDDCDLKRAKIKERCPLDQMKGKSVCVSVAVCSRWDFNTA